MKLNPYQINEAELLIPADWLDNSINIFRIPANENAKEASLVFSRDGSQGETGFAEFVMKQVQQCESQLTGFKLIRHNIYYEPVSYAWVDYQWQVESRVIMLRQIFLESKPVNLIVTLTTTPEDAQGHEAVWLEAIRNIKMRNPVVGVNPAKVYQ